MTGAKTLGNMSPKLLLVAERGRRDPNGKLLAFAHLIDIAAVGRAYNRQRKNPPVGVDGRTKTEYGQNLKENLQALHQRLVSKQYRHQPIRRIRIPNACQACAAINPCANGGPFRSTKVCAADRPRYGSKGYGSAR